ncbi:MAG: zinc-binding dehydrogenase, partial [Flavobacteriales bacterium]|nr:zinc-binding dehydrogenase [Flavobacteriales bacterium]
SLSFSSSVKYLKPQGRYITTMPHLDVAGFFISLLSRRKWGYLMVADTDAERMQRLCTLMSEGGFGSAIDSIFSLDKAADAFVRQQGSGKRGKIMIDFSGQ